MCGIYLTGFLYQCGQCIKPKVDPHPIIDLRKVRFLGGTGGRALRGTRNGVGVRRSFLDVARRYNFYGQSEYGQPLASSKVLVPEFPSVYRRRKVYDLGADVSFDLESFTRHLSESVCIAVQW